MELACNLKLNHHFWSFYKPVANKSLATQEQLLFNMHCRKEVLNYTSAAFRAWIYALT